MTSRLTLKRAVLVTAIAGFVGLIASAAQAVNSNWTATGTANWSAGGSWSAGVPTAAEDVANFVNTTANATATVDAAETVGQILFGGAAGVAMGTTRTWAIDATTGPLTLNNNGMASSVAGVNGALIQNFNTTANQTSGQLSITGGTITLADNLTIIVRTATGTATSAAPIRIGSVIAGNGNITFGNTLGAAYPVQNSNAVGFRSAIFLQGTNTFTGNVSVVKGVVVTDNASGFGNSANVLTIGDPDVAVNAGITLRGNVNIPNPIQTIAYGPGGNNTGLIGTQVANPAAAGEYSGPISVAPGSLINFSSISASSLTVPLETDIGLTVSGVISGSGGLEKGGGNGNANQSVGSATIPGDANTYTGVTRIGRGQLRVHSLNSVSNPVAGSSLGRPTTVEDGTIIMAAFGSFTYTALTYTGVGETTDRNFDLQQAAGVTAAIVSAGTGALTITGNVDSVDSTFGINNKILNLAGSNTGNNTISGNIGNTFGTLNLTKTDGGKWVLSGANNYTGTTTISNGILSVSSLNNIAAPVASSSLGTPTDATAGTIALGATTTTGTLHYTGAGETTDRVINLAGTTGGGTIDASGTGALVFTSDFTTTGAGIKTLTLQGSSTANNSINGAIPDNSTTSLTKSGAGKWILGGVNGYTGNTTITGGTLKLSNTGAIDSTPAIDVRSGATFDVSDFGGGYTLPFSAILKGAGNITGSISSGGANTIAPGDSGTGTLTVNGDLTLNSSAMAFDLSNSVGGANDKIGGVTNLSLSGLTTFNLNAPSGLGSGNYHLIDYTGSLLSGDASNLTYSGFTPSPRQTVSVSTTAVAKAVTLEVIGTAGNLIWKGNNGSDWDINTTVNWTGEADNHFFDGDNVTFNDTATTFTPSVTQDVQPFNVTFANTAAHAYNVGGSASINVAGSFTGGTGQVTIANSGDFGVAGNFVQNASGTTTINNSGTFTGIGGSITLDGKLNLNVNHDVTATNTVTGSGEFHKQGTNTVTLNGNGSGFTGSIFVDDGILKAGSTTALGATDVVTTVANGATLDLNGQDMVGAIIAAEGTGSGGSGGGIVNTAASSVLHIKGLTLNNDLTIVQNGTSIMTMDGTVASPGAFVHGGGKNLTVQVGPGGAIFGAEINLADVGDTNLNNISVSGGGTLWIGGNTTLGPNTGTLTLHDRGRLGFYTTTVINNKPIVVDSAASLAEVATYGSDTTLDSPIDIQGDHLQATIRPTGVGTKTLTLTGPLTGNGGLEVHHAGLSAGTDFGVVALTSNANAYAGFTVIGGGSAAGGSGIYNIQVARDRITLSVGNGGATGSLGAGEVTINTTGTLQFNRSTAISVLNNISGAGNLTAINPTGVVALEGTLSYNGTTTVSGGTLLVNGTHFGGGVYSVGSGATLGGTGLIDATVSLSGKIAPGSSLFTIGSLSVASGATLSFDLDRTNPASASDDLLSVLGSVDLAANPATLNFVLSSAQLGGGAFSTAGTWLLVDGTAMTGSAPTTVNYNFLEGLVGVVPTFNFDTVNGDISLTLSAGLAGDFNSDGKVSAADYVLWRKNPTAFGGSGGYTTWRLNFGNPPGSGSAFENAGSVPEPIGLVLVMAAIVGAFANRRWR